MRPALLLFALALPAFGQVRVELRAREPGESFLIESRGDDCGPWAHVATLSDCTSSCTWSSGEAPRRNRYRVRAVDPAGNVGPPEEVRTWNSCTWTPMLPGTPVVPVACVGDCSCIGALERLDQALAEILRWRLAEVSEVSAALRGLHVNIQDVAEFDVGGKAKAEGKYLFSIHTVLLTRDANAALHELLHAIHVQTGRDTGVDGHGPWHDSPALTEVAERFQTRWRGRSLWAPRQR